MNAVLIAVIVMLALALLRVHVVVALFIGAIVGGLISGMGLDATMVAFQDGLGGGAKIALSYALLGAFAMGVASAGLPQILANFLIAKLGGTGELDPKAAATTKWMLVLGLIAMAVMSQNLIPVHIAFIPLLVPPLLAVMNKLKLDRRLITTCLTFGLITTYMFIPVGFGSIYLNDILLFNIEEAGLDTSDINIMQVMAIPALGMLTGLLIAIFFSYRAPREYEDRPIAAEEHQETPSRYKIWVSILAIIATFAVQIIMQALDFESDGLLVGALTGLGILLISGAVDWKHADDVFTNGMKMMALIGFIMITAQGFASVMTATEEVGPLVDAPPTSLAPISSSPQAPCSWSAWWSPWASAHPFPPCRLSPLSTFPCAPRSALAPRPRWRSLVRQARLAMPAPPPPIPPSAPPPASAPMANTITSVTPSSPPLSTSISHF